jgi:hypothetical protein
MRQQSISNIVEGEYSPWRIFAINQRELRKYVSRVIAAGMLASSSRPGILVAIVTSHLLIGCQDLALGSEPPAATAILRSHAG